MEAPASEMVVRMVCRHAFHLGCLASHVQAKCQEAEEGARQYLRGEDATLELESGQRHSALGVARSLAEMHEQGQVRQCPRCGYGPVLNARCADMQRHDLDRGFGSDRTTNSCPNCSFFSNSWTDWVVWNAADPTAAVRCPLCRGPCSLCDDDIPEIQLRFDEADRRHDAASAQLSEALLRSRWSRSRCEDLIAVLLHFQDELQGPGHRRAQGFELAAFEDLVVLAEAPDRFRELLRGPLRAPLQRRLAFEEEAHRRAQDASEVDNPAPSTTSTSASTAGSSGGALLPPGLATGDALHGVQVPPSQPPPPPPPQGPPPPLREDRSRQDRSGLSAGPAIGFEPELPDGARHRRDALNQEILSLALRPGLAAAAGGANNTPEGDLHALSRHLKYLADHRRHLALVLCAAGQQVAARGLRRPWQPETGAGPSLPGRDAMERRINMRWHMMSQRGGERGGGGNGGNGVSNFASSAAAAAAAAAAGGMGAAALNGGQRPSSRHAGAGSLVIRLLRELVE